MEFLKLEVSKDPLGPFEYQKTLFVQFPIDSPPVLYSGNESVANEPMSLFQDAPGKPIETMMRGGFCPFSLIKSVLYCMKQIGWCRQ